MLHFALCRQAEFLAELALDQSFTGIGYWFLGLTDLGEKEKEKLFLETEMSFLLV